MLQRISKAVLFLFALPLLACADQVWTSKTDETLPIDFKLQGEYVVDGWGHK